VAGEGTRSDASSPPRPSEEIHLPGPSYLPVFVALGATLALVGVVISIPMFVIGVIVFLVPTVLWIREAREEFQALPLEHDH